MNCFYIGQCVFKLHYYTSINLISKIPKCPVSTTETQSVIKEITFEIQVINTQVSNPNEYVIQNTQELEHETTKTTKNKSSTHNHMNSTDQAKSCNVVNDDHNDWGCFCW